MDIREVIFFANKLEFRKWLDKNHETATELFVGYYKVNSGKPSMTWSESVDEALCYGWIDSVRKSINETSYCIRFTPRKPTSIWSAINIEKVSKLTKLGLMKPSGIASFKHRKEHKSKIYAYENEPIELSVEYERIFKSNTKAWNFFTSQAPSYQKTTIHYVMSAKQEVTRLKRLKQLIAELELKSK